MSPTNAKGTNPFSKSIIGTSPSQIRNQKNFIDKNIVGNTEMKKNVFSIFGAAFDKNIPVLEQRTGFTRSQIIKIFTTFKALCEITLNELKDQNRELKQCTGVNFENFKLGIPELTFETEEFARRVFE